MVDTLPCRLRREFLAVSIDLLPVMLATTCINIDLVSLQPTLTLPYVASSPEEQNDRKGEVALEEALGIVKPLPNWRNSHIKLKDCCQQTALTVGCKDKHVRFYLCNKDQRDEKQAEVRSVDTSHGLEWELVKSVAMVSPSLSEADVGQANRTPRKESGETGESLQPSEDRRAGGSQVDVGESTEEQNGNDGEQRSATPVHVGEDLRGIALLSQSRQSAATTIDTRHANRDDGYQDDDVHEMIKAVETGILADEHEGGRSRVIGARVEQFVIVVGDEQANKEKTEDIESLR
jgi:hypothetical protein